MAYYVGEVNLKMAVDTFFLGEKTPGDTWRAGDNVMYSKA